MQKIIPFLWFSDHAEEAANFYTKTFKNSKIGKVRRYDDASAAAAGRPKGSVLTIAFELGGVSFAALNGGPLYTFTPATSFFVQCESEEEVNGYWEKLSEGGVALMPLGAYPFSERYGWIQDRYGLSWQLMLSRTPITGQKILPALLFVGDRYGKAEEAMNLYVSLFEDSKIETLDRYAEGEEKTPGMVKFARFALGDQYFIAMDSGHEGHQFTFTGAVSFLVNCQSQEEIDKLWEKLSNGGEILQCGWLSDAYGVFWQITPTVLEEMLADPDAQKAQRVMQAMLQMKKIEISGLEHAAAAAHKSESGS